MSQSTARHALPFIQPAQAQKHVTHNEALEQLDLLVQLTVEAFAASTPPSLRDDGQIWALGPAPSGEWAGQGGRLAAWVNGAWVFVTPQTGWRAALGTDLRIWSGSDWNAPDLPELQNIDGLGIQTSFDATNRLAVASEATLLSHDGGGHQLKINKNAAGDTASVLFQTGWSGRAEFGLAGNDDFSVKVSPDGSTWWDALIANRNNGVVTLPSGAVVNASLSGTAVTQSDTDATANRVLRVGAGHQQLDATLYRRGNLLGTVSQSAGTPTGAVIQRGSNSNGEFVRFADGTQMCWSAQNLLFENATTCQINWVFPAQFSLVGSHSGVIDYGATLSNATPSINDLQGIGWSNSGNNNSVWRAQCRRRNGAPDFQPGDFVRARLFVSGRWF